MFLSNIPLSSTLNSMMMIKKFSFLFLLISVSLLSTTSFAGGRRSKISISELGADHHVSAIQDGTQGKSLNEEEVITIHERLLRANTKDYGRYDPSPSFSKPPYKLIPN